MASGRLEHRNPVDDIDGQGKPVDLIVDCQLERSVDAALFLVAPDVKVSMVVSPV